MRGAVAGVTGSLRESCERAACAEPWEAGAGSSLSGITRPEGAGCD